MAIWLTLPPIVNSLRLAAAGEAEKAYRQLPIQLPPPLYTVSWSTTEQQAYQQLRASLATQAGVWAEALREWQTVVAQTPEALDAWQTLAEVAAAAEQWPTAVDAVRYLRQQSAQYHSLYREILLAAAQAADNNHTVLAIGWLESAWQTFPSESDFALTLGNLYREQGNLLAAEQILQAILQQNPTHLAARWNLGGLMRLKGEYGSGWEAYELRWKMYPYLQASWRHYPFPLWAGESLHNKSILVWCEQGLGDSLQFCRFLPELLQLTQQVILECPPPLFRLLQANFPTIECSMNASDRHADYHLPLMSLPHRLGLYQPAQLHRSAYLQTVLPARLPALQQPSLRPRLGLVWQAGQQKRTEQGRQNADARSLSKELVNVLGERFPQFDWWNLQFDQASDTAWPWLKDASDAIADIADAAALLEHMDAIVTVDTMMAHLAGALGKKAWVLLHHDACWRWGCVTHTTFWYDSIHLIRQTHANDWDSVLTQLQPELEEFGTVYRLANV